MEALTYHGGAQAFGRLTGELVLHFVELFNRMRPQLGEHPGLREEFDSLTHEIAAVLEDVGRAAMRMGGVGQRIADLAARSKQIF
jgi:hypothetical protein